METRPEAALACIQRCAPGVSLFCLFIVAIPSTWGLEDGRIGVLYVGCVARSMPYWLMRSDPLFRTTFVQATIRDFMLFGPMPAPTIEDLNRLVRLYMPRTLEDVRNFGTGISTRRNWILGSTRFGGSSGRYTTSSHQGRPCGVGSWT